MDGTGENECSHVIDPWTRLAPDGSKSNVGPPRSHTIYRIRYKVRRGTGIKPRSRCHGTVLSLVEGNPPISWQSRRLSTVGHKDAVVSKYGIVDWPARTPVVNNLELRPVHEETARLVIPVDDGEGDSEVFSFL